MLALQRDYSKGVHAFTYSFMVTADVSYIISEYKIPNINIPLM